jgi:hypothetical protein
MERRKGAGVSEKIEYSITEIPAFHREVERDTTGSK